MKNDAVRTVADAIVAGRLNGQPLDPEPYAAMLSGAAEAYEVQSLVDDAIRGRRPERAPYWKSGGPSRSAALTHARLPDIGVWSSPADASGWRTSLLRVEAEIVLRLGCTVTREDAAAMRHEDAAKWVDAMAVAIELVDSRWKEPDKLPPLLKLADLQSHGALVVGEWVPFNVRDWKSQCCRVRIGEREAKEYVGTHSLLDPAWLLPTWARHVTRDGEAALAGTAVTTGTWCGMLPVTRGDRVTVTFDGIGHATVIL